METNQPAGTDVNQLGEFGLIEHLTKAFPLVQASTVRGIGDDGAVVKNHKETTVVSTDMLVEGIHFDLMYSPLKHLGYKAVVVNLSDICAMNAVPTHITMSLAISSKYTVEALEEFYAGVRLACDLYEVDLIGGDTTSSPRGMAISVTAMGQAQSEDIVYRSGAKVGDIICVTGDFGGAYIGLQLLEREKQIYLSNPDIQPDLGELDHVLGRQLKPEARLDAVKYMKQNHLKPTAMIDVSDGLASEIFHICKESGVGAYIEEGKVPIHPQTEETAIEFKVNPITCALNGGEDYELLFTVSPDDLEKVRYMPEVAIIGEITKHEDGAKLHTTGGNIHDMEAQGWKHFG